MREAISQVELAAAGERMHRLMGELFPICRSITGDGVRQTLRRLREQFPLEIHEVATGTQVFDWTIPREWNIRDAWVKNPAGEKVIDFARSNLHVMSYSVPVHRTMPLSELRPHLYSLPDRPEAVPYRTSYYQENWGFCLADSALSRLADGPYEVFIDSTLTDGALSYGEYCIPGRREDEVLLSCHVCHPSLANDNLSGVALVAMLAEILSSRQLEYSYRLLFIPGTIGAIAWLARNQQRISRIKHGLVVACVGDPGNFHYKRSRRGTAEIDRAVTQTLRSSGVPHVIRDFTPYGYDERQFCSPGFNLAVGSLTRTPHGDFPQYHTSDDNLAFVDPGALAESLTMYLAVLHLLENNARYQNLHPQCEPQLGRRGLYRALGGLPSAGQVELALLWVLNFSDGENSLLDIVERSGLPFASLLQAARLLEANDLLRRLPEVTA